MKDLAKARREERGKEEYMLAELVKLAEAKVGQRVNVHPFALVPYNPAAGAAKGACKSINNYFVGVELFYNDAFAGAVALAHEVGHLYTMSAEDLHAYNSNWKTVFGFERLASRWALAWLGQHLDRVLLARAERMLNIWLDSYYEAYNINDEARQFVHAGERVREEVEA